MYLNFLTQLYRSFGLGATCKLILARIQSVLIQFYYGPRVYLQSTIHTIKHFAHKKMYILLIVGNIKTITDLCMYYIYLLL
jgi:hypothetical protein